VSRLEVADIFRAHGPTWRHQEQGHLSLGQLKVMSAVEHCRSAELPAGFHRLRHYGLLANPTRKKNIEVARALLHVPAPPVPADPATIPASSAPRPTFVCRHCGAPMLIIETFVRAQHIRAPPALSASP
jgi:hypothetical protein